MSIKTKAYFYILLATLIWGIAGPVIKFTLGGMDPLIFLFYRFLISAVIAIPFLIPLLKQNINSKVNVFYLLLFGFLSSTVSLGFLFLGMKNTTVLDTSVISVTGPVITAIAAAIFLKEHITKTEKIGAGIAFLGTMITILEPIISNHGSGNRFSGNILIVFYLIADIASVLILKRILQSRVSATLVTHLSFVIGLFSILPIVLINFTPNEVINIIKVTPLPYHFGVIFMAIFSGTIAYTLRAIGQRTLKVEQTAIFGYLANVIAISIAIIFLGERFNMFFVIGAVVVVFGVLIAETKRIRL